MLLKDYATLFVRTPVESDPYATEFRRYDLSRVMAFEKRKMAADGRENGSLVLYIFPNRSQVANLHAGDLPEIRPGDYCAAGKWGTGLTPQNDQWGVCRRITAVTKRKVGSTRMHHMVIEAE